MGRGRSGANKGGGGTAGVNATNFFSQPMGEQVAYFQSIAPQNIDSAVRQYITGMVGGDEKDQFDKQNGLSDFIDSHAADALRVNNNPVLYRGGSISEDEFNALQVGKPFTALDSGNQLTSWSDREITAHMYAEDSKLVFGQSSQKTRDIVIVDTSRTNDAIVVPYTSPHNEVLRSKTQKYIVTKIVDASQYTKPIGRKPNEDGYYTQPVTYIYVTSGR